MIDDSFIDQLQKSLPFLPGHQFQRMDKTSERKSHAFDYSNDVAVFKSEAPGIGGKILLGQSENKVHSSIDVYRNLNETGDIAPAWVAFDRKVLRFYGYFEEGVVDGKRQENFRVRRYWSALTLRVNVYFYLEDDSVHVSEPKTQDSGIPQGTLIRRHRIPKAEAANGQHYTVSDFNVGTELHLYARTFKLVGCDQFTRLGITVPSNTTCPVDIFESQRKELLSRMKATRPCVPNLTLKQFLENDRSVLRFFCVWDDRTSVFGDLRHMVVHYYLSDDTIEIKESIPANSGRGSNALFLRRCRLAKRPKVQNLGTNENEIEYFTEADLMIGSVIHLYGRPFVICNCDDFTKDYYRTNYEIENFNPVQLEEFEDAKPVVPFFDTNAQATPMIGGESHVKQDFKKLLAYDGITLRYLAKLNSTKQVDRDRKFVVSYHLANDTITIFEPRTRNSGVIGGKFLENRKVKKPNSDQLISSVDFHIGEAKDSNVIIGAELIIYQHHFLITNADEFALNYMDHNLNLFPKHVCRS